jgi:hypothetical protein
VTSHGRPPDRLQHVRDYFDPKVVLLVAEVTTCCLIEGPRARRSCPARNPRDPRHQATIRRGHSALRLFRCFARVRLEGAQPWTHELGRGPATFLTAERESGLHLCSADAEVGGSPLKALGSGCPFVSHGR